MSQQKSAGSPPLARFASERGKLVFASLALMLVSCFFVAPIWQWYLLSHRPSQPVPVAGEIFALSSHGQIAYTRYGEYLSYYLLQFAAPTLGVIVGWVGSLIFDAEAMQIPPKGLSWVIGMWGVLLIGLGASCVVTNGDIPFGLFAA